MDRARVNKSYLLNKTGCGVFFSVRSVPLLLFIVSLLAYGLFFWQRGFYWDEMPWTWIYFRIGPEGLTKTFSTSRPFWGMIYQFTLPIIGPHPWRWQVIMVLLRWLTAVLVWAVLQEVWKDNPLPALWTSLLFLVYPALGQNFISLMYSHFYIILNAFLLSLYLSLLALRSPRWFWPLTLAAWLLALVNLLTMEYFYFLEFLRPVLFWFCLDNERKTKLRLVALLFVPYLLSVIGVTLWRLFFFESQNASYSYATLTLLRENFFLGTWTLIQYVLLSFWETVFNAWLYPFEVVNVGTLGLRTVIAAFALAMGVVVLIGLYLFLFSRTEHHDRPWARQGFLIGLVAWLFAGVSFWMVGIQPQVRFSADRLTMPFMLGSSLLVASLLRSIGSRPKVQFAALALLVGFSVGKQFQVNIQYGRDWDIQRKLFWQMIWRIPSLEPNSVVMTNDLPVTYFSDNSLSGPLNWIYSPPGEMNHIMYWPSVRLGLAFPAFEPDLPIEQNYLVTYFYGNTSRMLVADFEPPGCFRVLDPEIESENRFLPPLMREAAPLSNLEMINPAPTGAVPVSFYLPEPAHTWCYYFERADLARQRGDWEEVASLGDQAFKLDDYPNDPLERFVFVEGYAHVGQWEKAMEYAQVSYKVSKNYVGPPLCKLWERIEREVPDSPEKGEVVIQAKTLFVCNP